MKPDVKCSRCGFVVCGNDKLYDARKKRHTNRHTKHILTSERDGRIIKGYGMGNLDIGEVKWITIW